MGNGWHRAQTAVKLSNLVGTVLYTSVQALMRACPFCKAEVGLWCWKPKAQGYGLTAGLHAARLKAPRAGS